MHVYVLNVNACHRRKEITSKNNPGNEIPLKKRPFTVLQSIFHHAKFFWLCSESETLQSYGNANFKVTIYRTLTLKQSGIRKVVLYLKLKTFLEFGRTLQWLNLSQYKGEEQNLDPKTHLCVKQLVVCQYWKNRDRGFIKSGI